MEYQETPRLEGYFYSYEKSREARDKGELRAIRVETSLMCNLRCKYCCNRSGEPLPDEITYEELIDLINQAKELKAESVVVIGGGEPTIYPKFRELIKHIHSLDMIPVIFTNTQTMTKELARFLYDHNVSVITKLDSLDADVQDGMVGVKGAHKNIMEGLTNLVGVGYTDFEGRYKLGASFVVNKKNMSGIPDVWRFCRNRGIVPNLEMMVPNEKGQDIDNLLLSLEEWRDLKLKLLEIDREEYGYDWLPHTPHVGTGCFQVLHNLYISVKGEVRPCACVYVRDISIRNHSLKEIIDLPFFQTARNIEKHLEGKCKNCEFHKKCIGCRGLSFTTARNAGKDPVAALCSADPSCFK